MGISRRGFALLAALALLSGCFGYNRSAKGWAYAGNSVLMLGGGAVIALDLTSKDAPCMRMPNGPPCPYAGPFDGKLDGTLITGVMLVTAGLIGILINATRPNVKTSR